MIRARTLLKESYIFLFKYPSLIFYSFLYFLPTFIGLAAFILFLASVGSAAFIGAWMMPFSLPGLVKIVSGVVVSSLVGIILTAFIFLGNCLISLGFTAYIQQILKDAESASMWRSLKQAWSICTSVVWAVPVYCLYYLCTNTRVWFIALIVFCYVHQLLLDGMTDVKACFEKSFKLFTQSWWVIMRLMILTIFLQICLGLSGFFTASLAFFIPKTIVSIAILVMSSVLFLGVFVCWLSSILALKIGINKLYLAMKTEGE